MKKIAVISNTFPPCSGGGVATAQFNLFKALLEAGYDVRGFTFYDHGKINLKEDNIARFGSTKLIFRTITTLTKNYFKKQDYAWQWNFTLNSAIGCQKINKELKKFKPDIIILPDLGTPNYYIKKPTKDCKVIMISHHNAMRFLNNPLIDKHSEQDAKLVNDLENKGMKNVDMVVCPSSYMKKVFEETHDYSGPIEVIPNLVNEKLIQDAPKEDIKLGNVPLIYLPAANTPVKGTRYMFEIIRRLAKEYKEPIAFYLSGGLAEELAYELKYKPDNAIIYAPGYLDYEKNIGVIKSCDFGITPTLLESFGMAILEANFCGVPFVSFDCGGNTDIIADGEDGFLVGYLDIETMIEKALLLLSDKDLRQRFSQKASEKAFRDYDSGKTIQSFISKIS